MSKRNKSKLKSNCCNADIKIGGVPDFEGDKSACTQYYVCVKCNEACDVHSNKRKTWTINPKTQIIPDKREKNKKLFTEKELRKIHKQEDF